MFSLSHAVHVSPAGRRSAVAGARLEWRDKISKKISVSSVLSVWHQWSIRVILSRLAFRLPAFDALLASGWQWLTFELVRFARRRRLNEKGEVTSLFRDSKKYLWNPCYLCEIKHALSVWRSPRIFHQDARIFHRDARIFHRDARIFHRNAEKMFFQAFCWKCNHYYDKACPNLALLAPATETQIVTSDYLAPKLHPSCTYPAPTLEFGCNLGARWVQDGVQDYGG